MGNWVPDGTVGEVTVETEREAEESEVPRAWDLENEKREAWVSEWEEIGVGGGAMSTSDAMTEYWVWEIDKVLRLKRGKLEKLFLSWTCNGPICLVWPNDIILDKCLVL